ncbi:hypothetical protein C4D60_Mb04t23540 [Musa balbisiana]|uniref:C2H2-type domain-containing protein n=1 Tax=Musa balbisiana TaxID=52838 RepID=A0A4S8KE84_MUSBA|nr:hypothetical protein C4D60_Mb04t23540 [Musa balbisiana]
MTSSTRKSHLNGAQRFSRRPRGSAPPPLRPILYVAASGIPPIPDAVSRLLMPPSRIVSASCFRSAPIQPVQFLENNKAPQTSIMSTSQQIQALKIPEAVVALAQAAGKVSGETEKSDLPGWSLFPCKVQMLKCEKCSREFCSTINYRRHIRVHRRSLNIDKDSTKNRMLLGAFWDKLPLEEAREISSFKNVDIEDVTGSSIIRALKTSVQNLGLPLLPHIYVKAGTTLLNVIEGSPSRFPISSQELFGALDDASEETFLCAGSTLSMQKYIFSGDAGKIALETKNSVAFASFMLEQKLVKSWYADKDIEALRFQRVLMEEEEVAKKRQAELQERKRLKKLRKKEKRVNISTGVTNAKNEKCLFDTVEATYSSIETLNEMPACEFCQNTSKEPVCPEIQCGDSTRLVEPQLDWNMRQHSHPDNADQTVDQKIKAKASECQITTTSGQVPMSAQNSPNGHDLGEVSSAKSSVTSTNGLVILTSKIVPDREDANERNTDPKARYSYNEHEVLIGSISVTLRKGYDDSRDASAVVQKHFKKVAKNDLHPRWKESMIADHVTLTLPSDLEATRLSSEFEVQDWRL